MRGRSLDGLFCLDERNVNMKKMGDGGEKTSLVDQGSRSDNRWELGLQQRRVKDVVSCVHLPTATTFSVKSSLPSLLLLSLIMC